MDTKQKNADIHLWGIETHNLKNLDITFFKGDITAVMGVSGSGKSSLVFASLYGAAFQRFLSIQAPRFQRKISGQKKASDKKKGDRAAQLRPKIKGSANLPAAIALRQHLPFFPQRATVGSYSELYPVLRRLIVEQGQRYCPLCNEPLRDYPPHAIAKTLLAAKTEGQAIFAAPLKRQEGSTVTTQRLTKELMAAGFSRYVAADAHGQYKPGKLAALLEDDEDLDQELDIAVVVDKTALTASNSHRIEEAASLAYRMTDGELLVVQDGKPQRFFKELCCLKCQRRWPKLTASHYNPAAAEGQCPDCLGTGHIAEGTLPIADWWQLIKPQLDLPAAKKRQLEALLTEGSYQALVAAILAEDDSTETETLLATSLNLTECNTCAGSGVRRESLATELYGISFAEWLHLSIADLHTKLLAEQKLNAQHPGFNTLLAATDTLVSLRLGYLSLSEKARQLSGGEVQRIGLSKVLSSDLHDCLICLDEPTACLHPADVEAVLDRVKSLAELGNTVVVVDHHPLMQSIADHTVFIGPYGGSEGGRIVSGLPSFEPLAPKPMPEAFAELKLTDINCRYFRSASLTLPIARHRRRPAALIGVAGISGSGKSTLMKDVLIRCLLAAPEKHIQPGKLPAKLELPRPLVPKFLSQKALGRSRRSTLLTYLGLAAPLRKAFAAHPEARRRGFTPQDFNRHHKSGACPRCQGLGTVLDPHSLSGEDMVCPECEGHGHKKSILDIKHLGLSIVDMGRLTLTDALTVFAGDDAMIAALQPLDTFGLGYVTLGQPTSTYSGGQAQRLRLARLMHELSKSGAKQGEPIVILDEPSLGLSPYDVAGLIRQFQAMCTQGITVIIVEHNLELLRCCQWLVELGPGAGPEGSQIIAQGPRAQHPRTTTLGAFL